MSHFGLAPTSTSASSRGGETAAPTSPRHAVAVTLGDPRGIGPYVAFEAARVVIREAPATSIVLVGPDELAGDAPPGCDYRAVGAWDGSEPAAGRVAAEAIRLATSLAMESSVGAVVTAPIHKPALHAAGWDFPGHTEFLQELAGSTVVGMLMAAERTALGGPLRVLLATTHLALRDVPHAVNRELLLEQTRLLDASLRDEWGMDTPRLAMCALNPHASDRGLFGDEEARIFAPALADLQEGGVDIVGPVPADTVFSRAVRGEFDAVVAPYHDVGMAAFKTAAFGSGVNVTLGLPFVRTSPDHGTAFDLSATPHLADPSSMVEALRLAGRLTAARFDRESRDV